MHTVATRRTKGIIRFKKLHNITVNRGEVPTPPDSKTLAKNLLSSAADVIRKGIKPRTAEEQKACLEICYKCPSYIKNQNRCGKCGCYLNFKSKLRAWHCPTGKW
jgi:hypothetical protein